MGQGTETEVPSVYDMMSLETAQIERLTFMATRKMTFVDQFNFQRLEGKVEHNTPTVLGTRGILGQPREVQFRSSNYFAPRAWDWHPKGEQAIEVWVRWDPAPTEPVTIVFNVWGE